MDKKLKTILSIFLILGSLYFLFIGLSQGKSFLIPLTTAIILSMAMNPVAEKLMQWKLSQGWAVFISDLVIMAFIAMMFFLFVAQANKIASNWPQIEARLDPQIEQFENYLNKKLNIAMQGNQEETPAAGNDTNGIKKTASPHLKKQSKKTNAKEAVRDSSKAIDVTQTMTDVLTGTSVAHPPTDSAEDSTSASPGRLTMMRGLLSSTLKNTFSFLTDMLLMLVYIFFFMFYKQKFADSIVGFVKEEKKENARNIIKKATASVQKYLFGRFVLILILAALYIIGYGLLGLQYVIVISLIAALFSLIPYVGNIMGLFLAIAMSYLSSGNVEQIVVIVIVFSVVQFVESYILEPYIVGGQVDLNPVVVIVGVVLGGIVWDVMGMILAIPIMGILKVVLDNIPDFSPIGYILDNRGLGEDGNSLKKFKQLLGGK